MQKIYDLSFEVFYFGEMVAHGKMKFPEEVLNEDFDKKIENVIKVKTIEDIAKWNSQDNNILRMKMFPSVVNKTIMNDVSVKIKI